MRPMKYVVAAAVLGLMSQAALAFEALTVDSGKPGGPPALVLELPQDLPTAPPKGTDDAAKGLNLTMPEVQLPGTEVRIPGLGKVGVLPKLDFGLELLYGANEPK